MTRSCGAMHAVPGLAALPMTSMSPWSRSTSRQRSRCISPVRSPANRPSINARTVAHRQEVVAVGRGEEGGDLGFGEPVGLPDAGAADADAVPEPPGGVDVDAAGVMRPAEQRCSAVR